MLSFREGKTHIVFRFLTTYAFLAASLIIVLSSLFYVFFLRNIFEQIRSDAMQTAILAAADVDGDKLSLLQNPEDEATEEYQEIHQALLQYSLHNINIDSVYTLRPLQGMSNTWEFIVDGDIDEDVDGDGFLDDGERYARLGEPYDVNCCPDIIRALTEPSADRAITHDKWGHWISGYAPVYNSKGQAVAVAGVDISIARYSEQRQFIIILLTVTITIAVALSILFGFWGYVIFRAESNVINRSLEVRAGELDRKVKEKTETMHQFTAMLVHDLRAPLTAMKWSLQLLMENGFKANERQEAYKDLYASTENLVRRVNEMLDVSKIDAGKFTIVKKKGDITPVISKVVNDFTALAKKKDLEMSLYIQDTIPRLAMDKDRIHQVMENLLSNAIKFTDSGSIHIAVLYEKKNERVRVEVKDTGLGISKAKQKTLFVPFASLPSGEVDGSGLPSTGLGLAIVRGVVEAHKGEVGVISKKEKGSTFWFEIPIA